MAANVTVKTTGRIATIANLAAVKVSIDANSVSYATSLGGLAIDLYNLQQVAGPPDATINANDIVGILPLAQSTPGGFWPTNLAVGTQTASTLPCFVKLVGTGSANSAGFGEIVDGACTQVFTAYVLVARGGQN